MGMFPHRAKLITFLVQSPRGALVSVIMNTLVDSQTYVAPTDAWKILDRLRACVHTYVPIFYDDIIPFLLF